jgi:hypothetical protein
MSQATVICRKYAFSHRAAPRSSQFVSRTPFLVAYSMRTLFYADGPQIFDRLEMPNGILLVARPQMAYGSHLVIRGGFCANGHDTDNSPNWIIQTRSRLALRRLEKPATKAGQIRALWPDIEAALAVGQTMKTICAWLTEDAGITLGVTSLTSYISRIRRRKIHEPHRKAIADLETNVPPVKSVGQELGLRPHSPTTRSTKTDSSQERSNNPLAQAMTALSKPKLDIREIHGDGDPSGKNLI